MLVVGTVAGGPEVRRTPGSSREDPLDAAIRQISIPESEVCAFLNFRDCLKEHFGIDWYRWSRVEQDPPDYLLWLCGRQDPIGVEVTVLKACERLLCANAQLVRVLDALRKAVRDLRSPSAGEMIYEPAGPGSLPDPGSIAQQLSPLCEWLEGLPHRLDRGLSADFCFGRVSLLPARHGERGIHVVDQRFFQIPGERDWEGDVNESVHAKVAKYVRPPWHPCWLLLNLKPYLPGSNEARTFLSAPLHLCDTGRIESVFDRVYAVTGYIPGGAEPPPSPLRRLL